MEPSNHLEITPRRSLRLQRQRAVTPVTPESSRKNDKSILKIGPRDLMKLNKSKQSVPDITIIPATPIHNEYSKKHKNSVKKEVDKTETIVTNSNDEVSNDNQKSIDEFYSLTENTQTNLKPNNHQTDETNENEITVKINLSNSIYEIDCTQEGTKENVPESPSLIKSIAVAVKDATFSPEVDTSINDSRPHIDRVGDFSSNFPKAIALRTSTPLSQRVLMRETPKLSKPVLDALKKVLTPKIDGNKILSEKILNDTFNGQFHMGNFLEKSILKSTRRKRSLSVTDGESFMRKKVVFISPEVMTIDTIDEKMLQSFKEEKENSILKQSQTNSGFRRKRSLSVSVTPGRPKIKVPNFKAIHEQQFNKMESIVDHAQRKVERAKKLVTPSKSLATVSENLTNEKNIKKEIVSKIPTRKLFKKVPSTSIATNSNKQDHVIRSQSTDVSHKSNIVKAIVPKDNKKELPRIFDGNTKSVKTFKLPTFGPSKITNTVVPKLPASNTLMRTKVEERREKNMSMYKGNAVRTGLDHRKKNENVLKGVRLNRRFELQMQHRKMNESED